MSLACVVVAAGASRRMGQDKLWLPLAGRPVVQHCLETFEAHPPIAEIVLVCRSDQHDRFAELASRIALTKLAHIVPGGRERQDSVWAGLQATSAHLPLVMIHDAARPLIQPSVIDNVADAAARTGAAVSGSPVVDTIKQVDSSGRVLRTLPRPELMAVHTPQTFQRPLILRAYDALIASGDSVTDDTAAVERLGLPVEIVPSLLPNPKVTHPPDLPFLELLLAQARAS